MIDRPVDIALLRKFVPLDGLKAENLHALALKTQVKRLERGRLLFKAGDTEKRSFYLVSGSIELRTEGRILALIKADTPETRTALAPITPRKFDARAAEDIQYISIDSNFFDALLTWDQTGYYEAVDLSTVPVGDSSDWMTTLLQTESFQRIAPANIQLIFMRMQRIDYRAGDIVIQQGRDGDYFYIVASGKCVVRREMPLKKGSIPLAELGAGACFGEEALITGAPRSATVMMLTDGSLMRLSKADFQALMNEPQLRWVDETQAKALVAKGARWLDVRLLSEVQQLQIPGALHIPLYLLRLKLDTLNPQTTYIACCDSGRRSSAAAYILGQRQFEVYVLKGGLVASELARTAAH